MFEGSVWHSYGSHNYESCTYVQDRTRSMSMMEGNKFSSRSDLQQIFITFDTTRHLPPRPPPDDNTTKQYCNKMARTTAFFALCVLLGVVSASAQVTVLTKDNFDAVVVNGGKNAIVKFYAPWCVVVEKVWTRFFLQLFWGGRSDEISRPVVVASCFVRSPSLHASRSRAGHE